MEYAHSKGIVHRDIKPGNLLLDREGTVKILDMGLARIGLPERPAKTAGVERLTETWQVMGTSDYMAPEQAEDTHAVDHRADIYSLGCTLYRLLTGKRPYKGETPMQILLAHREAPIPSAREARAQVPPELDAVCQKMMAKRPEDRQGTMAEVIRDLQGVLTPATAAWPQPPTPPPVEEPKESSSQAVAGEPSGVAKNPSEREAETGKPEVSEIVQQREQASAARRATIDQYRKMQSAYQEVIKPVDERVAAWDFQGALDALEGIEPDETHLADRLSASHEAFKRLAALKARIIAALNTADPPLRTTALLIPGAGGDIVAADEKGITVKRGRRGTESLAWSDLGPKAPDRLVQLVIDPKSADDSLAAGILGLASGDIASAGEHFKAARAQGAETGPYLGELPRAAFEQALSLLEKEEFQQAMAALDDLSHQPTR